MQEKYLDPKEGKYHETAEDYILNDLVIFAVHHILG
jgi:hypothetical protein